MEYEEERENHDIAAVLHQLVGKMVKPTCFV